MLLASRGYRSAVGAVAASVVQQTSLADLAATLLAGVLAVCSAVRAHRLALTPRRRASWY
jgi:hypothetical protein